MTTTQDSDDVMTLINHVSDIVSAHVGHNRVAADELPSLITSVFGALSSLGENPEQVEELPTPAVPVRSSVKPDFIVCLEDGKKMTMLKRYLRTHYDMSPQEYRARWNLPADYPMVAPNYAEKRRGIAKETGLGRKAAKPSGPSSEKNPK